MRRAKAVGVVLAAVTTWGVWAAVAHAESFKAEGRVSGAAVLETEIGEKLEAKEAAISLSITELPASSGSATIELTHVLEPKSKTECQTGTSAGIVGVSGEFHLVWASLSPLEAAVLFLFNEVTASCNSGKLKVKIRQPVLIRQNAPLKEILVSLGLSANCTKKAKQQFKEYFNDEGKSVNAVLTANFGLGFEKACLSVEKELTLKAKHTFEIGTAASGLPIIESAPTLELPDVHILPGEEYSAVAVGETTFGVGTLESEVGEKLTFATVRAELDFLELSSLGPAFLMFTDVKFAKQQCNSLGDASGTVLLSGEYHLVNTGTAPLSPALLILFKEFSINCIEEKFTVRLSAPVLVKLTKVTAGTDTTELGIVSQCSGKGKQELREYISDEGALTKATPLVNFGVFEQACLNFGAEPVLKSNKMVDFLF